MKVLAFKSCLRSKGARFWTGLTFGRCLLSECTYFWKMLAFGRCSFFRRCDPHTCPHLSRVSCTVHTCHTCTTCPCPCMCTCMCTWTCTRVRIVAASMKVLAFRKCSLLGGTATRLDADPNERPSQSSFCRPRGPQKKAHNMRGPIIQKRTLAFTCL